MQFQMQQWAYAEMIQQNGVARFRRLMRKEQVRQHCGTKLHGGQSGRGGDYAVDYNRQPLRCRTQHETGNGRDFEPADGGESRER